MIMPTTVKLSLVLPLTVLGLLVSATPARAQDPPPDEAGQPRGPSERLQILMGDVTAVGLFLSGAAFEGKDGQDTQLADGLRYAALGGYLLAGPVVHVQHGHPGRAIVSLFLRAALPVAGAYIGRSSATCTGDLLCGLGETAAGFVAGTAVASIIDVALLSSASLDASLEPERARRPSVSLAPEVAVTPRMAFAGVGGRF